MRISVITASLTTALMMLGCAKERHLHAIPQPPAVKVKSGARLAEVTLLTPNEGDRTQPCYMDHHVKPIDFSLHVVAEHGTLVRRFLLVRSYDDPQNVPSQTFEITRDMLPEPGDWWLKIYQQHPQGRGHAFISYWMMNESHWLNFADDPRVEHACIDNILGCQDGTIGCGFNEGLFHLFASVHLPPLP
jgi:hypothetical protein